VEYMRSPPKCKPDAVLPGRFIRSPGP
jgi:hypothetical protein